MHNTYWQDFTRGLFRENPVFRLLLGLCPALGVTAYFIDGLGMGLTVTAVLLLSNLVISLIRGFIPETWRLPTFVVVVATFVTVADMVLQVYQPDLNQALGIFLPLMTVNCAVLSRAEAFASHKPVARSLVDGLGTGLGFTLALAVLAGAREVLGTGSFRVSYEGSSIPLWDSSFEPIRMLNDASGAFIALGLLIALANLIYRKYYMETPYEGYEGEGGTSWNT